MERFTLHAGRAGRIACATLAASLLAGCSFHIPLVRSGDAPAAPRSAEAEADGAIAKLESRVAKSPRNASARAELAQAYLSAGRFDSAATTFEDAVTLGEVGPRVGLGLALAYVGSGRNGDALQTLEGWSDRIPVTDLGLATALAGQPGKAIDMLSEAVRAGDASPKARQNLAYAYALAGRWAEARVVASQDVPADQIDARLQEWGSNTRPDLYQARTAALLGAPVREDAGQPAALALGGSATAQQPRMAKAPPTPPSPVSELPPIPAAAPKRAVAAAAAVPAPIPAPAPALSRAPAPVSVPRKAPASARTPARIASAQGGHLVQLGSFSSMDLARNAWRVFVARNPALKNHEMRISEAQVRGRRYFRVAAEGFDQGSARALCASVRQQGRGCIAYADSNPPPGAVPTRARSAPALAKR